jgi:hypothetical protein
VFHLEPGVHFEEVEPAAAVVRVGVHEELHGPGVHVAARVRHPDGGVADGRNEVPEPRWRSLLDQLLVAALERNSPGLPAT